MQHNAMKRANVISKSSSPHAQHSSSLLFEVLDFWASLNDLPLRVCSIDLSSVCSIVEPQYRHAFGIRIAAQSHTNAKDTRLKCDVSP